MRFKKNKKMFKGILYYVVSLQSLKKDCGRCCAGGHPCVLSLGGGGGEEESINGGSCHKYHCCRDKTRLCREKNMPVATISLSRQTCVCRDKSFVATSILLSRQKLCLSQQKLCNKNDICSSSRL